VKDYDTTIARIAGNLLSGRGSVGLTNNGALRADDVGAVEWAVAMAYAIVDEVQDQQHGRATSAIDARIRAADRKARA
jgi:hypothetical protein